MTAQTQLVAWFDDLSRGDVARVGGKNASLGEMVRELGGRGVQVPPGFATTADAYWHYVEANRLQETVSTTLADLEAGRIPLAEAGQTIRRAFLRGQWPDDLASAIVAADRLKVEAANAFLKTLEEPPAASILILLSIDSARLLETILSRCLRLNFSGEGTQQHEPAYVEWLTQFAAMAGAQQKSLLVRYRLLAVICGSASRTTTEIGSRPTSSSSVKSSGPR